MSTARFEWVVFDDLSINITTAGTLPASRYDEFIKFLEQSSIKKILATSVGSTEVDSVKRKALSDMIKRKGIKAAAVTDDRLVRGLITAASWLGADVKAFSWTELQKAIEHLAVPAAMQKKVYDAAMDLKRRTQS